MQKDIIQELENKDSITVSGICDAAKPYFITKVGITLSGPILWYVRNYKELEEIYERLSFWKKLWKAGLPIFKFFYDEDSQNPKDWQDTSSLLYKLSRSEKGIYLVTFKDFISRFPKRESFENLSIDLELNEEVKLTSFLEKLIDIGYGKESSALAPGTFAKKGGVLEIFPINFKKPIRIDFFDELVEKMVTFDPKTSSKEKEIDFLQITPIYNIEFKIQTEKSFKSFISKEAVTIIDEPDVIFSQIDEFKEIQNYLSPFQKIIFNSFPSNKEKLIKLDFQPVNSYFSNFKLLEFDIKKALKGNYKFYFTTKNRKAIENLLGPIPKDRLEIIEGESLRRGFKSEKEKIFFLSDWEIFGRKEKVKKQKQIDTSFLSELQPNDFVVHFDHGVARFKRVERIKSDGKETEYFVLEYAENDKLFVPIEKAEKLSKYIGFKKPVLHRLSEEVWVRIRSRAKKKTWKLAKELLSLYAKREVSLGFSYKKDSSITAQLEKDFEYEETPDQLKVIEEVKQDMESMKPMDRLVCGDVGYGKTEIAIRAAVKAVESGKQVAILAPTTILAQQHYDTFHERLNSLPITFDVLSRFRTEKEQKKIIKSLAEGKLDIVIGTHRLLSKDTQFKNLGLAVIDEEQRFGVRHKEKFKKMRENVDVLTMTATPIPRTLNFSLSGLRDISTIDTPPKGRKAVETHVLHYSEKIIKKAVKKELQRKGQVYFLHNKVETIDAIRARLKKLIPKAKFGIAHGRLPKKELAKSMHDFDSRKYDVLVCSTIIENGLDLPNVNTLIVNQATRFGLSELYQIKGRIGRSDRQGFAYFLYRSKNLKDKARQRLSSLIEMQELGSGFRIALKDMEIRGVGNILGKEQSGTASKIGLGLYLRLLTQAINELKTGKIERPVLDVNINLPLSSFIPKDFISKRSTRFKIYQELSSVNNIVKFHKIRKGLEKKYKKIPPTFSNLLQITKLRVLCQKADISDLKSSFVFLPDGTKKERIIIKFAKKPKPVKIYNLLDKNPAWIIDMEQNQAKIDREELGRKWAQGLEEEIKILGSTKLKVQSEKQYE
ncbi:transcription-repair coupling factor [bacterium (Candidatus Torokbacteria) CG_4_10_14_0_2_um_filter_35_8]|nr:MAG: transcription-repair coupling factor [bacterium (Candidatus Torokbacteria) CG_4_10_14_0_2_um_filter_35_8]